AYGNGYSDALMASYLQGGPLISVANTNGINVSAIDITMFDDNEPNAGAVQGYTAPVLYNVTSGPYVVLSRLVMSSGSHSTTSQLSIQLDVGAGLMTLNSDDTVTVGFYQSTTAGGVAQFGSATLQGGNLFQHWVYTNTTGTNATFSAGGNVDPTSYTI